MNMPRYTSLGFLLAGFMNVVGILLFSQGLASNALGEHYPEVMNRFGLVVVMLWGLAYWSVARHPEKAPTLLLVFALEKTVYTATWIYWLIHHGGSLGDLWSHDPLTALFFTIYGPNDLLFGIFFAICWWRARRLKAGSIV